MEHLTNPPLNTVLLVDDRDNCRLVMKWFLNQFGYVVDSARSGADALTRFDPHLHDAVVTDNTMPGMTGLEMAHIIKLRSPTTPIIMFTGHPPQDRSCLDAVLQRPAHLMLLKETLEKLLADRKKEG